jgi:hemin uptake protein HemP
MSDRKPNFRNAGPLTRDGRSGESASLPRRIDSRELLGGSGELVIAHGGREYRLRVTQYGKLILTA